MLSWMVIYPNGNRNKLDVAQVRDYEQSDWDIASRRTFHNREDCIEYMEELSNKHDISYAGQRAYLD